VADWHCADPRALRHVVPENRLRVYDVRAAMRGVADTGSLLELRAGFGAGIVTALARIEGKPVGLMANNPHHLGGAIDVEAADKSARFMQLCNAHGLPIVSLCDTPGFMVGPEIEAQAQVRHVCRMFMVASHLRVPFFAVVLRKGYGLGAQAMTAGGFDAPVFTVAWPTGEFGARARCGLATARSWPLSPKVPSAMHCSRSSSRSSTPTAKRFTWHKRWRSTR
jgi:acetyl-CoA carboxylase carboxyltransferase component